jgi:hypothetical protein
MPWNGVFPSSPPRAHSGFAVSISRICRGIYSSRWDIRSDVVSRECRSAVQRAGFQKVQLNEFLHTHHWRILHQPIVYGVGS